MVFWKRKSSTRARGGATEPARSAAGGESAATSGDRPKTEFLLGDALADKRSVDVLLDAIARVSESRDLGTLLDYVVDRSVEVTGAERGFLVLIDDAGEQAIRVARQRGGRNVEEDIKYSTSVVKRVLEEETPMRTTVQSDAEALELGASVFDLKLRAVMCVPLAHQRQGEERTEPGFVQRGALYVDSKAATREFKDEDLSLFFALAQHISIALENARLNLQSIEKVKLERSLEIASEIQSDLMPTTHKTIPGLDVHGWYQPAEHASGDFYDFVVTRDKSLAVVVGDVTGHGIGPALITATAQASLRAFTRVMNEPAEIVNMLNQDLAERMDDGMFLTLFLGFFTNEGGLRVVNAGHTPPLVWRAETGTIEQIAGTGPALGMMEDYDYTEGPELELAPGDTLVAFSDGLVEARHLSRPDRLFEEAGLRAIIADAGPSGPSARDLTESIVKSVLEFTGGAREDDMTVLAVRREPDAG